MLFFGVEFCWPSNQLTFDNVVEVAAAKHHSSMTQPAQRQAVELTPVMQPMASTDEEREAHRLLFSAGAARRRRLPWTLALRRVTVCVALLVPLCMLTLLPTSYYRRVRVNLFCWLSGASRLPAEDEVPSFGWDGTTPRHTPRNAR